MRKRSTKKSMGSASSLLSPLPKSTTDASSPPPSKKPSSKPLGFGLTFITAASQKVRNSPVPRAMAAATPSEKPLATVSDLKDMASARCESLKRHVDLCHAEVLKDFDAAHTRISKRLKLQMQACMQLTEEAEKEYKKMADRITENTELIKAEYQEFIKEAQSTAARVSKVSIPDLAQSLEKAIDNLRTHYGVPATQL